MAENKTSVSQTLVRPPMRRGGGHGPGSRMIGEKPKNFKKAMGKILKYCKSLLPITFVAVVFACAGSVISLIGPSKISDITNEISGAIMQGREINSNLIISIGVLLLSLFAIGSILNYAQAWLTNNVTQKISYSLRKDISLKINRLPLKFLDSSSQGDVLSRITNDVDSISSNLSNCMASLVSSVVLFLGCLVMMFITNWILALCAIGSTLIGFVFMRIIVKSSQKYFLANQTELGNLNGFVEETYTGHTVVKACNAGDECKRQFAETNDRLYSCSWKAQFFSGLMGPLMQFMGNFGFVVVCIVGAVLCVDDRVSIGTISAFIIYVRMFSSPLSTIGQSATSLQTVAACSERVFDLLEETELEYEEHKKTYLNPKDVKGSVEFIDVNFGYLPDVPVVKRFSAKIKPGQKIAIVGPTGAGKTTIVNLLMRFYEVGSGTILVDGVNIKDLTRENVHELFSMVLQDTWFFDGTIRENMVLDRKDVEDSQILNVCEKVELLHLVKSLPKGLASSLTDSSALSVGERQLLTIARSLIKDSPMLILDEATSSVDTRTEVQIQKAMDLLMKGRTSFIIAHRLSTIKNADKIFVLKDGDIIEQGTHNDLIEKNGFYAELYYASFNN